MPTRRTTPTCSRLLIAAAGLAVAIVTAAAPPADHAAAAAAKRLLANAPPTGDAQLAADASAVRDYLATSDDLEFAVELIKVADDDATPVSVRIALFQTLISAGPPYASESLLRAIDRATKIPDPPSTSRMVLANSVLRAFVEAIPTPRWTSEFGTSPSTPSLLLRALRGGIYDHCGNGPPPVDLVGLFIQAKVEPESRQAIVITLFATSTRTTEDYRLCNLLSEQSKAGIRERLELTATGDPAGFNIGGAFALAHTGDRRSRSLLKSLAADMARVREADSAQAAKLRLILSSHLRSHIRMIDAQHPREGLLEVVRDSSPPENQRWLPGWAMSRALELGVDREALRAAIKAHAVATQSAAAVDQRQPKSPLLRHPLLSELRDFELYAVRLGLLAADEVSVPESPIDKIFPQ